MGTAVSRGAQNGRFRLRLRETAATEDEGRTYECDGGTLLEVFRTRAGVGAGHTECRWEVEDIETVVADLREAGVTFDEFDLGGGVSTVDGIVTMAGERGAWFRDPDGNVLLVFQRVCSDALKHRGEIPKDTAAWPDLST